MKLLHTSDWHLGRTLYGKKRHREFAEFLSWLKNVLDEQSIDVLLVAGDVFDTKTPGNRAQELYYNFLSSIAGGRCRHVVITGGNHDSPTFLNAPQGLLRSMNIHVIGAACEDPKDEVLVLRNAADEPELIVCAVPYLRDRDLRLSVAGETIADKEKNLLEGIRDHYAEAARYAEELQQQNNVPIVAMGHLFTAEGRTVEGDGVRDLYIGSLGKVPSSVFPPCYDYLALGHLHVPQLVGGDPTRRYCGSPIAMGFGECEQQKSVSIVDFSGPDIAVELQHVRTFQRLKRISGDLDTITQKLQTLVKSQKSVWLEVDYHGEANVAELRQRLQQETENSEVEILRVRNARARRKAMQQHRNEESLDDLTLYEVFDRRLASAGVADVQRSKLREMYQQIVSSVQEADTREDS